MIDFSARFGPELRRAVFIFESDQSELLVLLTCPRCCRPQLLLVRRSLVTGGKGRRVRRKTILCRRSFRSGGFSSYFTLVHPGYAHVHTSALFFHYFHFRRLEQALRPFVCGVCVRRTSVCLHQLLVAFVIIQPSWHLLRARFHSWNRKRVARFFKLFTSVGWQHHRLFPCCVGDCD